MTLVLVLTLSGVLAQWRSDSLRQAQTTANLVALSIRQSLQRGDVVALDQLLHEVASDEHLERVIVTDPWGDPIADSAPDEGRPAMLRQAEELRDAPRVAARGSETQVLVPMARLGMPLGAVFLSFSLHDHQLAERESLRRGILVGIAALLAACALAAGLAAVLSAPLQRMAGSMDRAAGGQLSERVPEGGWLELDRMARSFNHMAASLRQRMHELRSLMHLGLVVSRSLNLSEVMDGAVRRIHGAFPGSRVQIWLRDRHPGCVVAAADSAGLEEAGRRLDVADHPVLSYAVDDGRVGLGGDTGEGEMPADPGFAARFGAERAMAAPLSTGAEVIGALVLLDSGPEADTERWQVPFLTTAAHQVALAVQNARLFDREARVSGIFQRMLRPTVAGQVPWLDVAVEWRPAPGEIEVAGDFYDLFALPDGRWMIAIGDVCGKGIVAATHTAMAKYVLRSYAYEANSPAEVLQRTNAALHGQMGGGDTEDAPAFITLFCALYHPETGHLLYSHAGHPLGVAVPGAGGPPVPLERGGLALGVEPEAAYEEGRIALRPGDTLALYSDGVMEASRGGELLEPERVGDLIAGRSGSAAADALHAVLAEVARVSGGRQHDDLTLLLLRVRDEAPWGANRSGDAA